MQREGIPRPRRRPLLPRLACCALCLWLGPAPGALGQEPSSQKTLAWAQELLDAQESEAAVELLDRLLADRPTDARALLMRSTARFMMGDTNSGIEDLNRALAIDPGLRQGWLNRAALDLSEGRLDEALRALQKARELDPTAVDNELNIGAVLLLQGRAAEAAQSFARYLEQNPDSAEALYLIASNYAMAGEVDLALAHLRQAIQRDEKVRLRARTDSNFDDLSAVPQFRELLDADSHSLPPGAHYTSRLFDSPYQAGKGPLLQAVLDSLQLTGRVFDRRIEVTRGWALIWSDLRIKITDTPSGSGEVQLSAPATEFTPSRWRQETEELFRQIAIRLGSRMDARPRPPTSGG